LEDEELPPENWRRKTEIWTFKNNKNPIMHEPPDQTKATHHTITTM
jgi:hypothetical protein